jgi:hypothetical protein
MNRGFVKNIMYINNNSAGYIYLNFGEKFCEEHYVYKTKCTNRHDKHNNVLKKGQYKFN